MIQAPGQRIHRIRLFFGVSQQALAAATGIGQMQLSRFERGLADPTVAEAKRIADAFRIPERVVSGRGKLRLDEHAEEGRISEAVAEQLRSDIARMQRQLSDLESTMGTVLANVADAHKIAPKILTEAKRRRMTADELRVHRRRLAAQCRAAKSVGKGRGSVGSKAIQQRLAKQAKR